MYSDGFRRRQTSSVFKLVKIRPRVVGTTYDMRIHQDDRSGRKLYIYTS